MTRKSKPPTNREMRANIQASIEDTSAARRSRFDQLLRAYESALTTPGLDQNQLAKLRKEVVANFNVTDDVVNHYAYMRFVLRYPDNDEPVKDE